MKLLAIALPFFGLLLLELGLRIGGFGYPTDFFLEKESPGKKVLIENRWFGWRFFPPAMARAPQALMLERTKPAGTVRIVVLGESAAMGDPMPDYGFARVLEVLLRNAYPNTRIEVVNAAMTAINSHAIVPIARDCAPLQADFWVIYMGNNEVVGPFGSGTIFGPRAPSLGLIRAALFLKTLKSGQLADAARLALARSDEKSASWQGMEMFLDFQLRSDDRQMQTVYQHFQRNFQDILAAGKKSGAKMIVCTVAASLKDCAPFASLHRRNLAAAEQAEWDKLVKAGGALATAGEHAAALQKFQAALNLDGEYAELHYRVAICQWELGKFELARASFQRALDLDALRFRVDSRLNEITRQLARERTGEGIYLLDTEQAIAVASAQRVPGKELFWEHVHFNFDGNYLLARTVADQVAMLWPDQPPGAKKPNWISRAQARRQLALTDWDEFEVAKEVRQRLQRPPFNRQWNHARQLEYLQTLLKRLEPRTKAAARQEQMDEYRQALAAGPEDWIIRANYGKRLEDLGDLSEAITQWQRVAEQAPHHPQAFYSLGHLLYEQGKTEEAADYFYQALRRKSSCAEAWNGLALCSLRQERLDEAVARCQQALKQNAGDPDSFYNLGIIYTRKGLTNEAIQYYRQALAIFPEHAQSHFNLGNLLLRGGRFQEAEAAFKKLSEISPDLAGARNNYGSALMRLNKFTEAVEQFREALRHDPDNVEARFNLGSALLSLKQWDEAIAHLEIVLAVRPNEPVVRQKLEQAWRLKAMY